MESRFVRVLLVLIALTIGSATAFLLYDIDRATTAADSSTNALRDQARTLAGTIANVRAGQVAYVAPGQGGDFWMGHVSKLLPVLVQQSAAVEQSLTAPSAQVAFDQASAAIENFEKLDSRAQDFVKGGNPLLAADLIFSDGLEAAGTASAQLDAAVNAELQTRQAAAAIQRNEQLAILGGGAGAILLLLMLLGFTGSARPVVAAPAILTPVVPAPIAQPAVRTAAAKAQAAETRQTPPAVEPRRRPAPNLAIAAQLCTDLARVLESKQLPGLLERSAKLINASGIIVWIAEPASSELRPAMSFGYSDQVMARMGRISRDANNAAAAAYRAAEMRTVEGAVVAPLLTPDGCIGVLSAEMKAGAERDENSQALAAIFAAQLATLVSPPSAAPAPHAIQA